MRPQSLTNLPIRLKIVLIEGIDTLYIPIEIALKILMTYVHISFHSFIGLVSLFKGRPTLAVYLILKTSF